jgi:hypothetical protein
MPHFALAPTNPGRRRARQDPLRLFVDTRLIIERWAKDAAHAGGPGTSLIKRAAAAGICGLLVAATALMAGQGCVRHERDTPPPISPPRVLVIAPVLISVAIKFRRPEDYRSVPRSDFSNDIDHVDARRNRRGQTVESPEDAVSWLAGADARVTGVTNYALLAASDRLGDGGIGGGGGIGERPRLSYHRAAPFQVKPRRHDGPRSRAFADAPKATCPMVGGSTYARRTRPFLMLLIRSILATDLNAARVVQQTS